MAQKPKQPMVRFRISEEQGEHLDKAWRDAGYGDLSKYARAVLLERTVVTVAGSDVVIIPAADSSEEHDAAIHAAITEALRGLGQPTSPPSSAGALASPAVVARDKGEGAAPPADGRAPGPPDATTPGDQGPSGAGSIPEAGEETSQASSAGAGAAPLFPASPPHSEPAPTSSSPGEGDGDTGPSSLVVTPPAADTGAGSPPGPAKEHEDPEETCARCGRSYPAPIGLHHSEEDCSANLESDSKCGSCGAPKDGPHEDWCPADRPVALEELKQAPEPLGGPQAGETFETFIARRVEELQAMKRPVVVARAEAESEWRQHVATAPAAAPTSTSCERCGTIRSDASKPCPDCGAASLPPTGGATA